MLCDALGGCEVYVVKDCAHTFGKHGLFGIEPLTKLSSKKITTFLYDYPLSHIHDTSRVVVAITLIALTPFFLVVLFW